MPKFNVRVPHTLSQDEARNRLNRFADELREKFQNKVSDLQQSWNGDALGFRFKTYGIPLSGSIAVSESELSVDGDLPFTAMMFKGQIESSIHAQLAQLVAAEK